MDEKKYCERTKSYINELYNTKVLKENFLNNKKQRVESENNDGIKIPLNVSNNSTLVPSEKSNLPKLIPNEEIMNNAQFEVFCLKWERALLVDKELLHLNNVIETIKAQLVGVIMIEILIF